VVHEIVQEPDGSLEVRLPHPVAAASSAAHPTGRQIARAAAAPDEADLVIDAAHGYRSVLFEGLPRRCRISASVTCRTGAGAFGLVLRAHRDGDSAYYLRVETARGRLVLDYWPRPGDRPFLVELERPLTVVPGTPMTLDLLIEETVCEVYVDGRTAMSARLYPLHGASLQHVAAEEGALTAECASQQVDDGDHWGVFASETTAVFRDLCVLALPGT
jgi:beta-fructofuranosidase